MQTFGFIITLVVLTMATLYASDLAALFQEYTEPLLAHYFPNKQAQARLLQQQFQQQFQQ